MTSKAFNQICRDFVMQQRLGSEDGDLEIEGNMLTPLDSVGDVYKACLKHDHYKDPAMLKWLTKWYDELATDALKDLRQSVGIVRRATCEGDRWTKPLSKNGLCRIINKHIPVAHGKPVDSNGSRFFKGWIEGDVDYEMKSKQRFRFNYEHLCSVFGDEEMARAAEDLGAD